MLTEAQKNALRYYIGVPDACPGAPYDAKIYNTLNCLFFPGLSSESARIREGRQLCPALLADVALLCSLLCDLYAASRVQKARGDEVLTRVERLADYEIMRQIGRTVSFTSTSRLDFLPAYTDKEGLVLMRFHLTPGCPMADAGTLLDDYAKPEEAEVLLPPGLSLTFSEKEAGDEAGSIRDRNGDPPVIVVEVTAAQRSPAALSPSPLPPPCKEGAGAGMTVLRALNEGRNPGAEETGRYCRWKKAVTEWLLSRSFF